MTKHEKELLKAIELESKLEIKKHGKYSGYIIPLNHPRNELTPKQVKNFTKKLEYAKSLLKQGTLIIIQEDRTLIAFDLA